MSPRINMVTSLNQALDQAMARDENVLVLGEDVGHDGGVFRVTEGLIEKYGPARVLDTPLAESAIVGFSLGLAIYGLRPVCELQFSGFSYQAFHQVEQHVARIRTRTRGQQAASLVIRMPYGAGVRALEHHSESKEIYYAHTPGLKFVIPSNAYDAKGLLLAAIEDPDPVIFYEPKKLYRAGKVEVPEAYYTVEIGKAKVVREGYDITVVSYGAMLAVTEESLADLDDIAVELIDLRSLSPLDWPTVVTSVQKTGRLVVVHEAHKSYGPAAEIMARVNEEAFLALKAPMKRVTGYDIHPPYFSLEQYYLPSPERILQAIRETMEF